MPCSPRPDDPVTAAMERPEFGRILPETAYYQTVVDAARVLGWAVHHQRSTGAGTPIMGDPGFPDFVLAHPRGHVLFVELKSDRRGARLSRDQQAWRDALVSAGARWMVVYCPSADIHTGIGLDDFLTTLTDLALGP